MCQARLLLLEGSAGDSSCLCEKVKGTSLPEMKRAAKEIISYVGVSLQCDAISEAAVTELAEFKPYRQGLGVRVFAQASEREQ
jgi:hypothetical protein